MNILKLIKAWKEVRRTAKVVKNGALEQAEGIINTAKQSALNNSDREYGEHLMRKLIEYDYKRQARARNVGFGYKRGSNY